MQGELTQLGKQMVMLDGAGRGWAIIETVELDQRRFDEVDAAFARDEGEGDRTLEDWREGHRRYFTRERGIPLGQLVTRGYWRAGEQNHPDHDYGDD